MLEVSQGGENRSACQLQVPQRLRVDMSEAVFIDAIGEELLMWLGRIGGQFGGKSCYLIDVCERLHLPIVRKSIGPSPRQVTAFAGHCYSQLNCPARVQFFAMISAVVTAIALMGSDILLFATQSNASISL